MISTSDFRNGVIFEHEGAIHQVVWFQHHKPGKGGAMMRCKLRNLRNGAIIEREGTIHLSNVKKAEPAAAAEAAS